MLIRSALVMLAVAGGVSAAQPGECALCARSVVTTRTLAACFLSKYGAAEPKGAAVAIDLTGCAGGQRGIVTALPAPAKGLAKPDTRFLVSPAQLDCLRQRLSDPALELDPQARIELDTCR